MSESRTKNVSINMIIGLICQGVNTILGFVSRTVFIKTLGTNYLGVNGLFSNVLQILSFANLGIGTAIVYNLYKPIAVGDKDKINSLLRLYKKSYRVIGIVIAILGLCVTPFLNYIIKSKPNIPENLVLLYWLFLADSVVSYFFVYKQSLITASQKNYIVLSISQIIGIVRVVVQVFFLYATHNYIIYLVIQILYTIAHNIIISVIADRMYPFIKKKAEPLNENERKNIFKNVRAVALYKFGSVVQKGTDNILVSALVGVREVGLVSNYFLLNSSCNAILSKIADAFVASVGNLNAMCDDEKRYNIFNKIFLISVWIYGFACVGLATVSNSLIIVWLGDKYILNTITLIAIVSEMFFSGIQFAAYTYRTTLGYFIQSKYVPAWSAFLNIVLSIIFFKWIGLPGIFFATPLSLILGNGISDPYLIYKNTFRKNPFIYWGKYIGYTLMVITIGFICHLTVENIAINGWLGVIVKIIAVSIIFNGIMMLIFGKTTIFRELVEYFKGMLRQRKRSI